MHGKWGSPGFRARFRRNLARNEKTVALRSRDWEAHKQLHINLVYGTDCRMCSINYVLSFWHPWQICISNPWLRIANHPASQLPASQFPFPAWQANKEIIIEQGKGRLGAAKTQKPREAELEKKMLTDVVYWISIYADFVREKRMLNVNMNKWAEKRQQQQQ